MSPLHWVILPGLLLVNDLTPGQQQQQYENLMRQGGTSTQPEAPFYNRGYGAGTTSYQSGAFGQQPAQHSPGIGGQPSAPATGFLNWQPGQHGYGN